VIVEPWSLDVSGDLGQSLTVGRTWSLGFSGNRGFSGRRWSLAVVGASVTGPLGAYSGKAMLINKVITICTFSVLYIYVVLKETTIYNLINIYQRTS
jgi:hypothetical protein